MKEKQIGYSDISATGINREVLRGDTHGFSINDPIMRKLANKLNGEIKFSDFKGKKRPNLGEIRRQSSYSNGGSGGGWSGWTPWYVVDNYGFLNSLTIDMLCECTDGNYDQMGSAVEVCNVNNESQKVYKEQHWGNGNNWTGSQRAIWNLGHYEMVNLGGALSKVKVRFKMYINRGSRGATNRTTVTLKSS